jgi:uncharacterized protein YndB with AHSA1/START domain
MSDALIFTESIHAPLAAVHRAVTTELGFRQWLCDTTRVELREGGSYLFGWHSGYYAAGQFTVVEPQRIAFTWRGHGQPSVTRVEFTLRSENSSTQVQIQHSGIGGDSAWDAAREQFTHGWQVGLENLKHVLETGFDLREIQRPVLGVFPAPLTSEQARALGVPVSAGLQVGGVVEGQAAANAGIQAGDVVTSIGGKRVTDFGSLANALRPYRGGDTVPVVFYRGTDKHTVDMTLSARPQPELPATLEDLAKTLEANYAEVDAELDALVKGVSDAQMATQPAAGEWSASENLAHLIWTMRFWQFWLHMVSTGNDPLSWPENTPTHLAGILAAYPKTAELVAALKREEVATVAMVRALPPAFLEHKPSYAAVVNHLTSLAEHHREHFRLMQAALAG